ncbi:MAG: hypothetical protein HY238_02965 [Acidobacteria bacterium]|nr:hypothetical protein [Acidobacteriota bacterium]
MNPFTITCIPTFCRGWGKLEFDRSSPDLTAHALLAWTAWREDLPPKLRSQVTDATRRAFRYLAQCQREDGVWIPLWFGNQFAPAEANPLYGTARVLTALHGLEDRSNMMARATQWLLAAQNPDGGWGGDKGIASTIEETGLAIGAVGRVPTARSAVLRGASWLVAHTNGESPTTPSPIGLYFARLWYSEELYPLIFALAGLAHARPHL